MSKPLRFVYVGKLNDDSVGDTPDDTRIGDTKYPADGDLYASLGGASANISRAVSTLGRLYKTPCSNTILTPLGDPPEKDQYAKFGQFLKAKNSYENALAFLNHEGIDCINVYPVGHKSGVASSNVTNFGANIPRGAGRSIVKNPSKPEVDTASADLSSLDLKSIGLNIKDIEAVDLKSVDLNSLDLSSVNFDILRRNFSFFKPDAQAAEKKTLSVSLTDKFTLAAHGLVETLKVKLEANIHQGDCVVIDTVRPLLAYVAAGVCHEKGIPYNIDYGDTAWPRDPDKAALLSAVLKNANRIIGPDDGVVDGMEANKRRPAEFFGALTGKDITLGNDGVITKCENSEIPREYKAQTVLMSNSTMPVCFSHAGDVSNINVEAAEKGAVNPLGVGDTRDGAFFFFIAKGDDDYTAADKATAIATIRIQYPDNEWEYHFYEDVQKNECFRELFKSDFEALGIPMAMNNRPVVMALEN